MTPTRSRTIIPVIASLAFGTLMAGPALGALSASPNPSTTGSYTVSDASPPALAADVTVGNPRRFHTYRLVETAPGGASNTYSLGRGPVSRSFTDQPPGTYTYQLQSCALILLIRAGELVDSNPCSNLGGSLSVTVTPPSPADPMPDFGTATVAAKGWTRNSPIAAFTVPAATGGNSPLSYTASGLPAGVSMSSARSVSGTPTAAGMGSATVTVRDKDGDTDTLSFAWTVAAPATPDLMPDFGDATIADQSWTLNTHITFVNVPAATGGDGRLTYSGSGLPAGVRFLTTTRVVLGRPTEAGSGTFTVTAADADGDTDTLSFDWTVVDPMPDFGDAPVSGKSWRVGQPIAAFYVPAASGGNSPLGYAATGLPGGVTMSAARRVSGTPTAAGSGTATVTVTDSDGDTDTLSFDWTVNEDLAPSFGDATVSDKSWTLRASIAAFTVPAARGGDGTLRYSVSGLPPGVRMASSTRRVSGYPTGSDASSGTATVTARDADGDTATLDFNWTVADPMPDFGTASVAAKSWTQNTAIPRFTAPAASGGNPRLRYAAAGLPDGVRMLSTRRVSGTPTAAGSGAATVTVRDYDGDTDTLSFDWTVSPEDLMPDFGAAAVTDQYWVTGSALRAPAVPAASGGNPPLRYAAAGLPRGVSMSSARSISGTPLWAAAGTATITVTDVDGDTDTLSFDWTTYDPLRLPVLSSKNWTQNRAIVPFGVAAAGGVAPLAHTVGGLPAGVTASSSGSVSGTPTGTGSGTATVSVTDAIGNAQSGSFTWRVAAEPVDRTPSFATVSVPAKSWTRHDAIAAFTVPAATGGDGTLTYSATGLPYGLTMSAARQVSGTPLFAGSGTATITARDTDGDTDTLTFDWSVAATDLMPDYSSASVPQPSWARSQAIAAFTVPAASGGNTPLSYTATGLPSGIAMSAARTMSGTPANEGTGTATVTVTDADGDTDTFKFDWRVVAEDLTPAFGSTTIPNRNWVAGKDIAPFTAPAATGGNAPLLHGAHGLPAGVVMLESLQVQGAPTATGSGTATVAARDADGDLVTVSFDWSVTADAQPSFSSMISGQSWTAGRAIAPLTVPSASGGNGTLSYGASGLPAGVTLSPTLQLSGTPLATGSGTATVTARDADGDTATLTFHWSATLPDGTGTVLSVSPNPTASANYTVSGAYTGTRSYIDFTLYETNPWGDVTPFRHASVPFTQAIASRLDGTYTYRLEGCYLKQYQNYREAHEVCETVGDPLAVTVDGPDPDSVGTQLGYTFQARVNSTSPATATMLFIDRTSSAAGGGVFQDIVLRKTTTGFELVAPSSVSGSPPSGWSVASTVDLVLNDVNLDGFVDVLVRGLGGAITGALDQIVYAPGRTGGSPTILTAVDSSLKNFLSEVGSWTQNPMFFQQHQETAVATITIYRENCFIDERRRYCRSYPIYVLERSGVRYTNKSSEAREFARQFTVSNGKINPDVTLGSQQARKLSGILEDVLGVKFFNANLERSCPQTQTMLVFDQFEIWCDNVTAFGRMIIDHMVGTDRKVKDAPQPGRGLNNEEIEFLEGYGPLESGTFSYDEVRIVPRSREFFRDNDSTHSRAYVTSTEPHIVNVRNSDYKESYDPANIEDVESLGAILHEVTHTCQLLCEGWKHGRHPMEKGMQYLYRVLNTPMNTDLNFEVLGPDQQAEIIHDRMRTNEGLQPARPGNVLMECVEMEQPPRTGCVNDVERAVAVSVMRDELNGLSIPGAAKVPPDSE